MGKVRDFAIAPFKGSTSTGVQAKPNTIRTRIVNVSQTAYNKGMLTRRKGRKR